MMPTAPHGHGTVIGWTIAPAGFRTRKNCLSSRVLLTRDKRGKALWCFAFQPTIQSSHARDIDGLAHASLGRPCSWYPHGQPCDIGSRNYADREQAGRPSQNGASSRTAVVTAYRECRTSWHYRRTWCWKIDNHRRSWHLPYPQRPQGSSPGCRPIV